jgi:hypothetical protein
MSSTPLPVIHGASAANYPFELTYSFLTGIGEWQNGAQQRWIRQPGGLVKIAIPYAQMTQAQKNTVKAAFTGAAGRFEQNLEISLPFGGSLATFFNFGMDADEWAATESKTTQYAGPMRLTQSITQSLSPGTPGLAFPTLANGTIGILPYVQKKRFQTVAQKVEAGPIYTLAEFGGGLSGYPKDGLMSWEFDMQLVSDADLVTLVAHFIANWGRAYSFLFKDEASGSVLSAAINSSVTAIPFATDPALAVGQAFEIDAEQFHVTAVWGGATLTATRAYNGTTAAAHLIIAPLFCVYLNTHWAVDDLVVTYRGVNDSSLKIMLEATN